MGYSRGKRGEREVEEVLQDRRVLLFLHTGPTDPVDINRDSLCHGHIRHWRHAQASSLGHGIPLHPSGRHGELMRLSVPVRGLGRTTPVCPMLFLM